MPNIGDYDPFTRAIWDGNNWVSVANTLAITVLCSAAPGNWFGASVTSTIDEEEEQHIDMWRL